MEKLIKFSGWTPSPNTVTIGMERDNKVFSLKFEGMPDYPNGTAYLHIDCGENGADSIEVVDGTAEITRNVTQYEGEKEAYVEILADGDVVWHSDVIMVTVRRLPILGEKIEQAYPTAFEQALAQTAADKAAAAKSAAAAAATAEGIVTEEAARKVAESKRVAAEQGRVEAEAQREERIAGLETEVAKKAQIDDTIVSDAAPWSSQHIVDMLCPPLQERGNPVICYPVAGSKLDVKASWEPTQEGTGTPSPDNIRPIHGRNNISITRQEDELSMSLTLPSTIYGGEVNAVKGDGQNEWKLIALDGTENWIEPSSKSYYAFFGNPAASKSASGYCSHYPYMNNSSGKYAFANVNGAIVIYGHNTDYTLVEFRAYLAAQYAAGTPIEVAYKLATPVPFTATGGGTIKALSGINTILTDADALTVTGRADPIHIIQQLQAASAASAQDLADVERAVTDI